MLKSYFSGSITTFLRQTLSSVTFQQFGINIRYITTTVSDQRKFWVALAKNYYEYILLLNFSFMIMLKLFDVRLPRT